MSAGKTEGPWVCYGYGVIRGGTAGPNGYPPGKIPYVVPHVEKQGDRDLIAAAPDLVEALSLLYSALLSQYPLGDPAWKPRIEAADAALRKAGAL